MSRRLFRIGFAAVLLALALYPLAGSAQQQKFPDAISNTWASTDWIVWSNTQARTWMWGPGTFDQRIESYQQSPNGQRQVFYYDKSRMEISNPDGDANSIWFVTNGLLVNELMSGRLQVGDNEFEDYFPAQVNVAGDADDPSGPTYATMGMVSASPPYGEGAAITARIDRAGTVSNDPSLAGFGVTASMFVPETNHRVAAPFWNFMTSTGKVYDPITRAVVENAPLFPNPYFATGFPVTEAYFATVKVGGTPKTVLVQCFQRRCLTFTPDNAPEWQVEAGNVGRHYHTWRYEDIPQGPPDTIPPPPAEGAVIYESPMTDWATGTLAEGEVYVADGEYRIRVTQPDAIIWATLDLNLADFSFQFDTRVLDPNAGQQEACLTFRWDNSGGVTRDYAFCINQNAEVYAFYEQWDSQGAYEVEGMVPTSAHPAVRPATEWNTLKVIAQGNQFWFIVNGQPVAHATHDALSVGDVGAATYNYTASPAAEWAYRNAVARAVGDAPPPPPDDTPVPGAVLASFDPATAWESGQLADNVSAEVRDGVYHVRMTAPNYQFFITPDTYGDASIAVDVRLTDATALSAACVVARLLTDPLRNYELCVSAEGSTSVAYYDGETLTYLLDWDTHAGLSDPSAWNTLEIRARGNEFWFFTNGVQIGKIAHQGDTAGVAGFEMYSWEEGSAEWAFRNLIVRALQ